jgi:hypothetical protein
MASSLTAASKWALGYTDAGADHGTLNGSNGVVGYALIEPPLAAIRLVDMFEIFD